MKTKILTALCTLMLVSAIYAPTSKAQSYDRAIGLNLGMPLGINYKQFINSTGALDFTLGYQSSGVMLTAVFQHHINLVDNLDLYLGGGVNIGVVGLNKNANGHFALGIDPAVGFEYKFDGAPVALAVDYTPQINLFSSMNFATAAFKIRFTL